MTVDSHPRARPLRGLTPIACLAAAAVLALVPARAGAFTYGNFVATRGEDVVEVRLDGVPVATIPVPYPPGARGASDPLGAICFDQDARLAIFNGAAAPWLSVYEATGPAWTHTTVAGWSTIPIGGLSGLGTIGRDVFVSDFGTAGGIDRGVIRFDGDAAYAPWRFAELVDVADVAIGPDGLVHALLAFSGNVVIHDPVTGQWVDGITLEGSVQAFAIRPDGAYYGVSGDGMVRRFTPQGISVDTLSTGIPGLLDVAIGPGGDLVMGSALGEAVICDGELTSARTILIGTGLTAVAWVPFHASTPATSATWGRVKGLYRR